MWARSRQKPPEGLSGRNDVLGGKDALCRYHRALGSARETLACLAVAQALGYRLDGYSETRPAAEDTLLDQALISVSSAAYAEFLALLDAPAKPNERLRRTMRAPVPWKSG